MTQSSRLHATRTTTALLDGLHDVHDHEAWHEFDRRYRGLLTSFAMKLGLDDADAADVAQETLARFLIAYREGRYDRQRGRLRSWLIGIARGRVLAWREHRVTRRIERGDSVVADLPDEAECDRLWELARRRAILLHALERLRGRGRLDERTVEAFELTSLHRVPPATVAERLGMTTADVYRARHRVLVRIREIAQHLESTWDEVPA